jgi:hypothetical protein
MNTLLALAIAAAPLAGPALAQNIGDQFRCPGPEDLPDVLVTVGRTDMLSELLGEPVEVEETILHLQLVGAEPELPLVPHAPFVQSAIAECVPVRTAPFERAAFGTGFDAYKAEVRSGDAGYFQISPAEAYWLTIGGLDDGG